MKQLRYTAIAAGLILLMAASACNSDSGPEKAANAADSEQVPDKIEVEDIVFDPKNFSDPTKVDNQWLPLKPGTQFIYEGSTKDDEDRRIPHRVVFTVTDLTKEVNGVRTVVGWDRDYTEGKLEEAEIIFLAQADDGNVWHLGQLREVYDEEGEFVGNRAWLAGLEGAKAGIMMKAEPREGTPGYSQGYAPAPISWDDHARAHKVGEKTCVPAGCYENVLVTDEFELDHPGAHQLKYYAPGVGYVRVGFMGDDPEEEVLELVQVRELTAEELAEASAEALKIEKSASWYGTTSRLEPRPAAQ